MASKSLTFDIFGRDKSASKTMKKVGTTGERMGKVLRNVGKAVAVGMLAAGAAMVKFGIDSVKTFAEAEDLKNKLNFAYEKFPAIADVNIKAMRAYNLELQKKTRYDDDATGAAQAILAQFGLTGKQLKEITPLVQDYATATKKDLSTAATDLGKALMGQTRALKDVGVDMDDAGSVAANYDGILAGLSKTVKGFAEKDATTASGKLQIMQNRFSDVQEVVGGALMDAFSGLVDYINGDMITSIEDMGNWLAGPGLDAFKGTVDWIIQWKDVLGPAAVAVGALTAAQWMLNIAMDSNPVGAVILALGLLVTAATLVATNWETIVDGFILPISRFEIALSTSILRMARNVSAGFEGMVNGALGALQRLVGPLNAVLAAAGQPQIIFGKVDFTSGIDNALGAMNVAAAVANGWRPGTGSPTPVGPAATSGPKPALFAAGGFVKHRPGGVFANIGEGRHDEVVLPLTDRVLAGIGGRGTQVTINLTGSYAGSKTDLAKTIVSAIRDGVKTGVIPRGAIVNA